MAYKFQVGSAILSGALTQEGSINVKDDAGTLQANIDRDTGDISTNGTGSFSGDMMIDGLMEVTGTTLLKQSLTVDAASDFNGVITVSGAALPHATLTYDLGSSSKKWSELHVGEIKTTGITGSLSNALTEGNGIVSFSYDGGSTATVAISGSDAFDLTGTDLRLSSSIAGDALALSGQVLGVNVNSTSFQIASDEIQFAAGAAGAGLALNSDALDVQVSGAVVIDTDKVGISGSIAGAGLSYAGGVNSISSLAVASDELAAVFTDTAVDVGADSILFIDNSDTDNMKKESIADLVSAMAGAGLAASSGVLSVQSNNMNVFTSAGDLSEGYNVQNATTSMTMILPTGSQGDVVSVKAGNLASGAALTISKNVAQSKQIDGLDSILLESAYGAVTLVYANDTLGWRIV